MKSKSYQKWNILLYPQYFWGHRMILLLFLSLFLLHLNFFLLLMSLSLNFFLLLVIMQAKAYYYC